MKNYFGYQLYWQFSGTSWGSVKKYFWLEKKRILRNATAERFFYFFFSIVDRVLLYIKSSWESIYTNFISSTNITWKDTIMIFFPVTWSFTIYVPQCFLASENKNVSCFTRIAIRLVLSWYFAKWLVPYTIKETRNNSTLYLHTYIFTH